MRTIAAALCFLVRHVAHSSVCVEDHDQYAKPNRHSPILWKEIRSSMVPTEFISANPAASIEGSTPRCSAVQSLQPEN